MVGTRPRRAARVIVIDSSDEDEAPPLAPLPVQAKRRARAAPAAKPPAASAPAARQTAITALLGAGRPARAAAAAASAEPPAAAQGSAAAAAGGLWSEVHAPRCEEDLVVHKKKVQEVRSWLEAQAAAVGEAAHSRVLVVTGPSGSGKSATLRALAAPAGLALCEWQAPTPTLWREHTYQGAAAVKYTSKLDAFDEFVLRSKMPALSLQGSRAASPGAASGASAQQQAQRQQQAPGRPAPGGLRGRPKLIVVDDLPHAAGVDQRQRLAEAVGDLARTTRFPVVLCLTTESSVGGGSDRATGPASAAIPGLPKDLARSLEQAHPTVISFNPVTAINAAKALRAVLDREGLELPDDQVKAIAEQAGGDLRCALNTLQLVCSGRPVDRAAAAGKAKKGKGSKRKQAPSGGSGGSAPSYAGRDGGLGLFHALGKLLYNKRLPPGGAGADAGAEEEGSSKRARARAAGAQEPAEGGGRPPMEFDPEAVLDASGMEAGSVAAFLHENLPAFVSEDAIEDLAECLAYLSDADCIATSAYRQGDRASLADDSLPAVPLAEAAAGSTAARGVCYSNAHPAPRRWQPLRAPVLFAAQRAAALNAARLDWTVAEAWAVGANTRHLESRQTMACELLPAARLLLARTAAPSLQSLLPARWARVWEGAVQDGTAGQPAGGTAQRQRGEAYEKELPAAAGGRVRCGATLAGRVAAAGPAAAAEEEEDLIED